MFRQKIAQVADCSCRLMPGQASEYQIFKTQNSHLKFPPKEPKEKYSLKTQTTSSTKNQHKLTSAQKICLKPLKPSEQQKISISANLDAKRLKIQKNLVCSPENSNVRKLDQKVIFATNTNSTQNYWTKMPNSVKTAEANRKINKGTLLNSHNQNNLQQGRNHLQIDNFMSQKSSLNQKTSQSRVVEAPKKSLNFEEYYKYVSNPYSASEKNKENIQMGDNAQISKYKMDLKIKKEMRKMKNQTLPLQEIDFIPQIQVFHESLEKYESMNQKQSRGTHNGSMATKNSLNSQPDSMKTSKNNQVSLLNSKLTNFNQNPSLQFQKVFHQGNALRQNHSLVALTHRDQNIGMNRISRKDLKSHMVTDIFTDQQSSIQPYLSSTHRPVSSIQNSGVRSFFNPFQNLSGISTVKPQNQLFEGINKKQPPNQRIFIEKINTLNDIMNNSAQCESLMGEGEENFSENEESVVIMRYQDLVETQNRPQIEDNQFWLQPQQLLVTEKDLEKTGGKYMLDSIKVVTNVKTCGRQNYNPVGDSLISTNPHLKRTVKVNKEYLTNNFSHAE